MKKIMFVIVLFFFCVLFFLLYIFNIIPHKQYDNDYFHIKTYISRVDKDNDGVDDQTDILENVRKYIQKKPKYKSKYYETGYPNDEFGVCTDVVAQGLLGAGYDLMELVHTDILENREKYDIAVVDKKIDFRRVKNLAIYFKNNSITLTTDIEKIEEWQGGDIVIFNGHIGIVSDKRNKKGIPFVIHHANPYQIHYEEDLFSYRKDIIGHYRMS